MRATLLLSLLLLAPCSWADDNDIPVRHIAAGGFSNASGRALRASGQTAVGVSVAPVVNVGSVAAIAVSTAGASVNASGQAVSRPARPPATIGAPLPISQEVITVTPAPAGTPTPDNHNAPPQAPDQALQPGTPSNNQP